MKALVTGGGGFLGLAIVRALKAQGVRVRSVSRSRYSRLADLEVEQVQGDLSELSVAQEAVAGCDVVYHVAAKAGIWGAFDSYYRPNVLGTENVIAACRHQGVGKLIFTSSPSVVFAGQDIEAGDESLPYAPQFKSNYSHTKALAEQRIVAANCATLATVSLRPHLIWGPGDNHLLPRLVARAKKGQLRRIGSGNPLVDTVYIDNAARAHLQAAAALKPGATCAGKVYFISNGEPIPLWDMVNRMLIAVGAPPVNRTIPVWLARAVAWGMEMQARIRGGDREPRLTRFVVGEMSTAHWFNIGAARKDFGYLPEVSIEQGLVRLRQEWSLERR